MVLPKYFFMHSPGGENEEGSSLSNDSNNKTSENESLKEQSTEEKPFMEKVHDALQDWSNDDQAEQDFDDTQP